MIRTFKIYWSGILKVLFVLLGAWLLFHVSFFLGTHPTKWLGHLFQTLTNIVWTNVENADISFFLIYGFLTGLGGFVVYLPNIIILFLFSHLLRDSGLSAKAAQIVHPLFRKLGLSGASFLPLVFGFGCTVAALQAAKAVEQKKPRLLTMLLSPFMSCGSKFGVYVLLVSIMFRPNEAGTALFTLYLLGICFALLSAVILRRFFPIDEETISTDLTEPVISIPSIFGVLIKTVNDGWVFAKKAGTVIVLASIVIWALSRWPGVSQEAYNALKHHTQETGQQLPPRQTLSLYNSYIAKLGRLLEPFFAPIGLEWKSSVAIAGGFAGRGVIISTLLAFSGIENGPGNIGSLTLFLRESNVFTKLSICSFMVFVLLSGSCLAGITMFFHETGSVRLTLLFIVYPLISAWIVSLLLFQGGKILGFG